jgi:hypothetical protein
MVVCAHLLTTGCSDKVDGVDSVQEGCPDGRYQVLDPGGGSCSAYNGSGLVKDTSTGLTWMRYSYQRSEGLIQAEASTYCAERGMRLPTEDEALGIAGSNEDRCAFPCGWYTWTSTPSGSGQAWVVFYSGNKYECTVDNPAGYHGVLCVR